MFVFIKVKSIHGAHVCLLDFNALKPSYKLAIRGNFVLKYMLQIPLWEK